MGNLIKTSGRSVVSETVTVTRPVWVSDTNSLVPWKLPISSAPILQPSNSTIPSGNLIVVNCTFNGQPGFRLARNNADGSITYLSPCTANEDMAV